MPQASLRKAAESTSLATLKPDLEAPGERRLAAMEIAALLRTEIPPQNGANGIHLPKMKRSQLQLLARRLAFTDHLTVANEQVPCTQAVLERRYSELSDLNGTGISGATRRRNDYLT